MYRIALVGHISNIKIQAIHKPRNRTHENWQIIIFIQSIFYHSYTL